MVSNNRARRCFVRCPESNCRGGCEKIAKKPASHINCGGGGALQLRLTLRRATYYLAAAAAAAWPNADATLGVFHARHTRVRRVKIGKPN